MNQPGPEAKLTVGRDERIEPPAPYVAAGLAILIGIGVFAVLWKIRKTFGMKE